MSDDSILNFYLFALTFQFGAAWLQLLAKLEWGVGRTPTSVVDHIYGCSRVRTFCVGPTSVNLPRTSLIKRTRLKLVVPVDYLSKSRLAISKDIFHLSKNIVDRLRSQHVIHFQLYVVNSPSFISSWMNSVLARVFPSVLPLP